MKKEDAEKVTELLYEIKELEKYKNLFKDREYKDTVHFEIHQHYGDTKTYQKVVIPRHHNKRFFLLLDNIIDELNDELKKL